jgi:large repetitive protein
MSHTSLHTRRAARRGRAGALGILGVLVAALVLGAAGGRVTGGVPVASANADPAQPHQVVLQVTNWKTGEAVPAGTRYDFLINEDNVGDSAQPGDDGTDVLPAAFDPVTGQPALRDRPSNSPVVAKGGGTLTVGGETAPIELPHGKYLVSLRVPGHKLGGQWFVIDGDSPDVMLVPVELVEGPHPLAKIRVKTFHDDAPVNLADDVPAELPLDGFEVHIFDAVGEVTVDYDGNPLCGGDCRTGPTDTNPDNLPGEIVIKGIPPGKYEVQAVAPDGSDWVQTTTIEGTKGIDAWVPEGWDGNSPDEGFNLPIVSHGFVKPMTVAQSSLATFCATPGSGCGPLTSSIKGQAVKLQEWTAFQGSPGFPTPFELREPISRPYVAVTDVGRTDRQIALVRGDVDGNFEITGLPMGTYQVAIWDEPIDYLMSFFNATITTPSSVADLGKVGAPRWFGSIEGSVFEDENSDGIRNWNDADNDTVKDPDEGPYTERGIPNQPVGTRFRDGSLYQGTSSKADGSYRMPEVFPFGSFNVTEVGFARWGATGASSRQQAGTTDYVKTKIKDTFGAGTLTLGTLTFFGMDNEIDWGKKPHAAGENGGISGVVYHATTRNELNPAFQAPEDYEPGIPDVTVNLYATDANGNKTGLPIASVLTDKWSRGTNCDATGPDLLPLTLTPAAYTQNCVEMAALSNEEKPGVFDGGYAFSEITHASDGTELANPVSPIPPGDYVVEVISPAGADGNPIYHVVREEDLNTDQGDELVTPTVPAPPCAGELHKVRDPRSPFNDQWKPLCDRRLVTLEDQANAAADFHLFVQTTSVDNGNLLPDGPDADTEPDGAPGPDPDANAVPLPGRIHGFILDDVNIETNPLRKWFADKRGLENAPIGIRDYTGRLLTTVNTDSNGHFEVLVPSTNTINAPTPGGVSPAMYVVVANDPGDVDAPNTNYSLRHGTRKFWFDVYPGKTVIADIAPLPITAQNAKCETAPSDPELFYVTRTYLRNTALPLNGATNAAERTVTIHGANFGATPGTLGKVSLSTLVNPANPAAGTQTRDAVSVGGLATQFRVTSWGPSQITIQAPQVWFQGLGQWTGPRQLTITNNQGRSIVRGITLNVWGGTYQPAIRHVSQTPDPNDTPLQDAIDAAPQNALIVVEPGTYYESVIVAKRVKIQGYGSGINQFGAQGSTVDARFFDATRDQWLARLAAIEFDGNQEVNDGAAFTVVGTEGLYQNGTNRSRIDGLRITGGRAESAGGIHLNAFARYFDISNNHFEGNQGGIGGGAISLGEPLVGPQMNTDVSIRRNSIVANGGLALAGGIGIYNGSDDYRIEGNFICGNYSNEYGGGISHYGYSERGLIRDNTVAHNAAFDEGGGIMIAGELPPANTLGIGSGPVTIDRNRIQGNLTSDDGGGIRTLAPLTSAIRITNNVVDNNVAADIGGGISLDDTSNADIASNTVVNNKSLATALDSDGAPHGAGLTVSLNSALFQQSLPSGSRTFSDPALFNNVFLNNRAFCPVTSTNALCTALPNLENGLRSAAGTAGAIDFEVFGATNPVTQRLSPRRSLLTVAHPASSNPPTVPGGANNTVANPATAQFASPVDIPLTAATFGIDANLPTQVLVTPALPAYVTGDFHLAGTSQAQNIGATSITHFVRTQSFLGFSFTTTRNVSAPALDIDRQTRPIALIHDAGADERAAGGSTLPNTANAVVGLDSDPDAAPAPPLADVLQIIPAAGTPDTPAAQAAMAAALAQAKAQAPKSNAKKVKKLKKAKAKKGKKGKAKAKKGGKASARTVNAQNRKANR